MHPHESRSLRGIIAHLQQSSFRTPDRNIGIILISKHCDDIVKLCFQVVSRSLIVDVIVVATAMQKTVVMGRTLLEFVIVVARMGRDKFIDRALLGMNKIHGFRWLSTRVDERVRDIR